MAGAGDRPRNKVESANPVEAAPVSTCSGAAAGRGEAATQTTQQAMTFTERGASDAGSPVWCVAAFPVWWQGGSDADAAEAATTPSDSTDATPISIRMNRTIFTAPA